MLHTVLEALFCIFLDLPQSLIVPIINIIDLLQGIRCADMDHSENPRVISAVKIRDPADCRSCHKNSCLIFSGNLSQIIDHGRCV